MTAPHNQPDAKVIIAHLLSLAEEHYNRCCSSGMAFPSMKAARIMNQVEQSKKRVRMGQRRRWPILVAALLLFPLIAYVGLALLCPRSQGHDPRLLLKIKPGMTRQEVEKLLGQPLAPQPGREGIMVRSNQPNRSLTPGLIEEEGLDLYFDDQGVLRESKGWGFVRPESFDERIRRRLGL